ncbi:hypothetical protein M8C21_015622, partial [Ambrosia artemisiifolia]
MNIPVVLSKFMFDEPSGWVTMATVVTLLSTIYLGFAEIIGSHLQYSKFTNNSKHDDDGMMKVSSRRGMLILYTPAFLAGFVSFFVFPGGGLRFLFLKLALTFHFFKRDFEGFGTVYGGDPLWRMNRLSLTIGEQDRETEIQEFLGRAATIGAFVKRGEEAGYTKITLKGKTPEEKIVIMRKIDARN